MHCYYGLLILQTRIPESVRGVNPGNQNPTQNAHASHAATCSSFFELEILLLQPKNHEREFFSQQSQKPIEQTNKQTKLLVIAFASLRTQSLHYNQKNSIIQ